MTATAGQDQPAAISYLWDETVRTLHPKLTQPGTWESGTWVEHDGVIFAVTATAGSIGVQLVVPTRAQADAIAAQFPKSCRAQSSYCTSSDWEGERGTVNLHVGLLPDANNQGVNETGLKRYRSFARTAARLGYQIRYRNAYANSMPEAEFTALTGR